MTDIIIKPSNSGGSVKLQTEGGTNGLTMASTGVLTTSGNVAITGTMTGGAIGSGVTGTLGSGVTFPAGHIVQVIPFQSNNGVNNTTTNWTEIPSSLVSITTKTENPLIIYHIIMSVESDINSTGHGVWTQLIRSSVSPYSSFGVINSAKIINFGNYNGSFGYSGQSSITDYDYPEFPAGTRLDYKLRFIKNNAGSLYINQQGVTGEPTNTDNYNVGYIMEVQQ